MLQRLLQQQGKMMVTKYLTKRRGSSAWQLRVPVPRALHATVGKREVTLSLRTEDRRLAERQAMAHVLRLQAEWDRLRQPVSNEGLADLSQPHEPDEWELQDGAFEAGFQLLSRSLDATRREKAAGDPAIWAAYREERRQRFIAWEQRFAGEQWGEWERVADRLSAR